MSILSFKEYQYLAEGDDKDQKGNMSSDNENKFTKLFGNKSIPKVNLNTLAHDLTMAEDGKENQDIGEVKQMIALFGDRWRSMQFEDVMAEIYAIIDRAG